MLDYIDAYEAAGNALLLPEARSTAWIDGALGVNEDNTAQSDFIRDYNNLQAQSRYGASVTDAQMDKLSDEIAYRVTGKILDRYENNDVSQLPIIEDIAVEDAAPTATTLFNGNEDGWAGNPLFVVLGDSTKYNENILDADGDTYDVLSMVEIATDVIAGPSGNYGLEGIFDSLRLYVGAELALFEADALSDITAAKNATDLFLNNAYGVDLYDAAFDAAFGQITLGTVGNDTALSGSSGNLIEFLVDEIVHAGDGNDTVIGGDGDDILDGGRGTDLISFENYGSAVAINLETGRTVVDDELKDYLYNFENVFGSAQNDTIHGDNENNGLSGLAGDDNINGQGGNDILIGGLGNDTLNGGTGDDTYIFATGDGQDTIIDSDGVGSIKLDGSTVTLGLTGTITYGGAGTWNHGAFVTKHSGGNLELSKGSDRFTIQGHDDGALGVRPVEWDFSGSEAESFMNNGGSISLDADAKRLILADPNVTLTDDEKDALVEAVYDVIEGTLLPLPLLDSLLRNFWCVYA